MHHQVRLTSNMNLPSLSPFFLMAFLRHRGLHTCILVLFFQALYRFIHPLNAFLSESDMILSI